MISFPRSVVSMLRVKRFLLWARKAFECGEEFLQQWLKPQTVAAGSGQDLAKAGLRQKNCWVELLLEDIAQLNRLHATTDKKKAKTSVKSV